MCNFRSDGSEEFGLQGSSEAIADINPEDIESMTVLSGAAAAAPEFRMPPTAPSSSPRRRVRRA